MAFAQTSDFALAAAAVEILVGELTPEQWAAPTACTQWNVAQVVEHLIEVNERFAAGLGAAVPADDDREIAQRYRHSSASLLDALRGADAADGLSAQVRGRLALRVTDLLVHGWDIATATGWPTRLPEDVSAQALAFAQGRIGALRRGGQFADPQPVADDAPTIDRLAALSGRAPANHSPAG